MTMLMLSFHRLFWAYRIWRDRLLNYLLFNLRNSVSLCSVNHAIPFLYVSRAGREKVFCVFFLFVLTSHHIPCSAFSTVRLVFCDCDWIHKKTPVERFGSGGNSNFLRSFFDVFLRIKQCLKQLILFHSCSFSLLWAVWRYFSSWHWWCLLSTSMRWWSVISKICEMGCSQVG